METQTKHKDINCAFLAAQRNMSNAKKGSNNPFFKTKYADLNSIREAVMDVLLNEDIMITQPEVIIDGRNYVRTVLTHAPTGTTIQCDVEILIKNSNDPQAQGSAITYARRYGLQSLCAIGADDDDGNKAAGRGLDKAAPQQAPQQAAPQQAAQQAAPQQAAPQQAPQQPASAPVAQLTQAIFEINSCQDEAQLRSVWTKYVKLQKEPQLLTAKDKRKNELTK